jgi:hypothetical protein
VTEPTAQSDEALLDRVQRAGFEYFLEQFNPANGLVADTSRAGATASIAVVGFALSCYPAPSSPCASFGLASVKF